MILTRPMAQAHPLGSFRIDADSQSLLRGAEPSKLGRRAVAVLRILLQRAGEPVSKETLIEAAWPGLAVEENNLSVQISALRRVLGPECIETLPRRGYR